MRPKRKCEHSRAYILDYSKDARDVPSKSHIRNSAQIQARIHNAVSAKPTPYGTNTFSWYSLNNFFPGETDTLGGKRRDVARFENINGKEMKSL